MTGLGLTDPQMRALEAVHDLSGEARGRCDMVSPRQVALALWPDSAAWDKRTRRQDGTYGGKGATMPMNAGQLLKALKHRELVQRHPKRRLWALTDRGLALLARAPQPLPFPDIPTPKPVRRRNNQEPTP
jgi:hypothetical protein